MTEMQTGLDILYHFGGCSGGQCQNGDIRQQFAYLCDFQIGGTEVIPHCEMQWLSSTVIMLMCIFRNLVRNISVSRRSGEI